MSKFIYYRQDGLPTLYTGLLWMSGKKEVRRVCCAVPAHPDGSGEPSYEEVINNAALSRIDLF
jgi:hypothetical protein